MSRHTAEQIAELLRDETSRRPPEPPADLLDKIARDIPRHLVAASSVEEPTRPPQWTARRTRLLAASLFVAVAATIVATRVLVQEPSVSPRVTAPEKRSVEGVSRAVGAEGAVPAAESVIREVPSGAPGESGDLVADRPGAPAAAALGEIIGADSRQPDGQERTPGRAESFENLSSKGGSVRQFPESPSGAAASVEPAESEEPTGVLRPDAEKPASPAAGDVGSSDEEPSSRGSEQGGEEARQAMQEKLSAVAERAADVGRRVQKRLNEADTDVAIGIVQAEPPAAVVSPVVAAEPGRGSPERPRVVRPPRFVGSAGGTTEPNDAPYGDVFFEPTGVNPFVDTEDDNLSTFGLDVDTGSYTVARRYLEDGNLPPAAAIRVEEFVNYFDYGDPAPRRGDFAIAMEGAPSPFAAGPRYQLLRFGIRARDVVPRERRPATLVFVVDTSGSMEQGDRIGLVKRALTLLLDELGRDDRVGLVEYSTRARILLEPTRDKRAVERALDYLVPNGSTNAEEGLLLGYELAGEYFRRGDINRVILCSDGVANVGRTGPEAILERIEREAERGIEITTVGFGMGNYNDVLMEQLADRGNGRYAYVDDLEEARRIFVENLTGTLQTVARDAKVQVEFNPAVVSRYRLLGYENRDIADRRFRDNSVDAGEIGAGHTVTALYEVKLHDGADRRADLATLHLRWESVDERRIEEIDRTIRIADLDRSWRSASPSLRLATVVAEFAEILKSSYWARGSSFEDLLRRAERLEDELRDAEVSELVDLMIRAARHAPDPRPRDE